MMSAMQSYIHLLLGAGSSPTKGPGKVSAKGE